MNQDLLKVFETCLLCPGICNNKCPVYRKTHLRTAAPSVLGRLGTRIIRENRIDLAQGLRLCVECGLCLDACPVKNPLPSAIQELKRIIYKVPESVPEPITLLEGDEKILIVSSTMPAQWIIDKLREQRVGVLYLDSYDAREQRALYGAVGLPEDLEEKYKVYCEDYRLCPEAPSGLKLLLDYDIRPPKKPPAYTLLLPCGENGQASYEEAVNVYGTPSTTVDICGIPDLYLAGYEVYTRRLLKKIEERRKGLFYLSPDSFTAKVLGSLLDAPIVSPLSYR